MVDSGPVRQQFSLRELFLATALVAVWCAAGRFFPGPWLMFTFLSIGPALFFLGQRWRLYLLEVLGLAILFVSPCLAAVALGALQSLWNLP